MGIEDKRALDAFLSDFVQSLTAAFPGRVSYIRLHGSGVRGDFRIGESDVDLIVGVRDDADVRQVEGPAFRIFWELNEKHGLMLGQAHRKKQAERILRLPRAPPQACRPFVVAGPSYWAKTPSDFFSRLDPLHGFSKSLLSSGRRDYRDIFGKSRPLPGRAAEPGVLSYDFLSALLMVFLAPIAPNRAFVRSVKACFFTFQMDHEASAAAPGFPGRVFYLRKYSREQTGAISYPEMVLFCLEAPLRILWHNVRFAKKNRLAAASAESSH